VASVQLSVPSTQLHVAAHASRNTVPVATIHPPQDLDPLSSLPKLTTLVLLGNPVALKRDYRCVLVCDVLSAAAVCCV
jgi:hypothetical protein